MKMRLKDMTTKFYNAKLVKQNKNKQEAHWAI